MGCGPRGAPPSPPTPSLPAPFCLSPPSAHPPLIQPPAADSQEVDGLDITLHGETMLSTIELGEMYDKRLESARDAATDPLPHGPRPGAATAGQLPHGLGPGSAKVAPDPPAAVEVVASCDDEKPNGEGTTAVVPFS